MKVFTIAAIIIFFSTIFYIEWWFDRTHIEQKIRYGELVTYVWINGEISKSWHDPIENIDSAFIAQRRNQAEDYIKFIESLNLE